MPVEQVGMEAKPVNWTPNRKPNVGLATTQIVAVLSWLATAHWGLEVPAYIQVSGAGALAYILMYWIKEPE